jgi:hypothetical protein
MGRKNILFIMCDQLRFDYLGCAGHPSIKTPNIDALAKRGVRFSNVYCQSPNLWTIKNEHLYRAIRFRTWIPFKPCGPSYW